MNYRFRINGVLGIDKLIPTGAVMDLGQFMPLSGQLELARDCVQVLFVDAGQSRVCDPGGRNTCSKKGKPPVLTTVETRLLLNATGVNTVASLRDRVIIGVMVTSFARLGAVAGINVEDYLQQGRRWWFRLYEMGGKRHEMPAYHNAEAYLDAYVEAVGDEKDKKGPVYRSLKRTRHLTDRRLLRHEVLAMIKRRARGVGLSETTCFHTFRATGITTYLENGGTVENAQQIAAHKSPRTTKLADRTSDSISLDEIERITISMDAKRQCSLVASIAPAIVPSGLECSPWTIPLPIPVSNNPNIHHHSDLRF